MEDAMREVVALSKAMGTGLDESDIAAWRRTLSGFDPANKTSMLQDVEAGRRTEVDAFAGTVLRLAEHKGIEVPVNRMLHALLTAIEELGLDPAGLVCLDAGASTGGFTDCLLQFGAARVYAADVGYGQLHWSLRQDQRVVVLERVNLKDPAPDLLPEAVDLITADVSFISVTKVLAGCLRFLKPGGLAALLIKPQFELGPGRTDKGVVRGEADRQEAIDSVVAFCRTLGLSLIGLAPAGITGPKGNQEYLALFRLLGERPDSE
jgi:23S rRNA (cytidine1920-2'-O)/16S rRNA (cytidine1409-2'-O)-methyltransferase